MIVSKEEVATNPAFSILKERVTESVPQVNIQRNNIIFNLFFLSFLIVMKSVEITQSWFTEEKLPTVEVTPLWTAIKTMPLFIRKRAKKVKFRKKYVETFFF